MSDFLKLLIQKMKTRLYLAIQRANAACVLGTAPSSSGLEGLFESFLHKNDEN